MNDQLMFNEYAKSYYGKPLGVFGQFSVTSTYIVFFYMILLSTGIKIRDSKKLLLLILIVLLLQDSGSGYIALSALLLSSSYRFKYFRSSMIIIFLTLITIIIMNIVPKISYIYIEWLYYYFYDLYLIYCNGVNSFSDILFGIDGSYLLPIDFGPLFMISKVGLLFFILYVSLIMHVILISRNIYITLSLIMLLISNLHYPILFYPLMNIFLPLLIILVSTKTSEKTMVSINVTKV